MATWECEECGIYFKRSRSGNRPIRFCSPGCYQKYRKRTGYNKKSVFYKGSVPWNKGVKGIHLSPKTEFRKGCVGVNHLPVGATTGRKCKGNMKRWFVKIAEPNKWILRCLYVWKNTKGSIPKGLLVHHLDGNTENDTIDNLCLLTRAGHMNIHRETLQKAAKISPKRYGWGIYGKRRKKQ